MVSAEALWRRDVLRLAAPVAALAAATGAVLLGRAALDRGDSRAEPAPSVASRHPATSRRSEPAQPAPLTRVAPVTAVYVVRSGDTLAAIAERRRTSVERLLELNPGIDPAALVVGQSIRVP
jgi:nucleoid-associated protein YgaU